MIGLEFVTDAPGVVFDRTPAGHYGDGPRSMDRPPSAGHRQDFGAEEREHYDEPTFQFTSDRINGVVVEPGYDGTAVNTTAVRRGLNGDPVNNPPVESYGGRPWRFGQYRQTWKEHNYAPPPRVHTYRIVSPYTASAVGDAPPPAVPSPYSGPYSHLARSVRNIGRKPMLRRPPEPLSEAIISDQGGPPAQVPFDDWVAG
jgi:hypothetical protein